MKGNNCVFCNIIQGEAQAYLVYQDELVSAFLDISPINDGHVLVVPNVHAADLATLEDETAKQMFVTAKRLAAALRAALSGVEGINLLLADGQMAGQTVFHSHLHVIPRFAGDGVGFPHGNRQNPPTEAAMASICERLSERLRSIDNS